MSQGNEGYGQFFKQARKASGLSSDSLESDGPSRSSSDSAASGRSSTRSEKRKFNFRPELGDHEDGINGGVTTHFSQDSAKRRGPPIAEGSSPASPEQRLRQRAGEKMQARKRKAVRKKAAFPLTATAFLVVTILGAALGYYRPDICESIASHVEFGAFGQARAADAMKEDKPAAKDVTAKTKDAASGQDAKGRGDTTASKADGKTPPGETEKVAAAVVDDAEKSADGESGKKDEKGISVHGWTPEELSFFNKLNERKKELDQREAELNKLDEELQKQKLVLDEKIKQLDQTRAEISSTLKTRVATDQAKIDKLVDFYSTMKPQQAAKVIESLNEDLAVTVLDKMKKKNAAEVLNLMDAKKARRLSELLTGYERTPASSGSVADETSAAPAK